MLELWEICVLITVGLVSGYLNVMAGGGSLITLPVMIFLGVPGAVANGTNRIGILAQNIVATTTFIKRGFREFRLSLTLSLCTIPGVVVGAMVGSHIDGVWFNRVLAMVMILVMVVMSLERKPVSGESIKVSRTRYLFGHALMVVMGFYGGFIQVGIGLLMMPILHRVMGMDLVRVNAHKVIIVGFFTIIALCIYASQVEILWLIGGVLALGNMLGGWLGAHFTLSKGERLIRITLNLVLVAMIAKLLFWS